MKNLLLTFGCLALASNICSAQLPEPSVAVLPQNFAWFDAFAVTWAQVENQPYQISIVDTSGIEVTKNYVEDLHIIDISLVEYQESETSQNYPNSRLLITLSMLEAQVGSYYTLSIPAGAVLVDMGNEKIPNEELSYTFQLNADHNVVTLPEPNIDPLPGVVSELSVIKMSWTGKLGSLDLLNALNDIDKNNNAGPITMSYNGIFLENPVVSFEWSSRNAVTFGSAGDILVLTIPEGEELQDGEYVITIPKNYLQITDIETGTLYNDEISFGYTLNSATGGIGTIKGVDKTNNEIYNLNGVKINGSDLNSLPKGVYIINGKKVKN